VAAHELVHIREEDGRYVRDHVTIPALLSAFGVFVVSLAVWPIFFLACFLALFGWLAGLLSLTRMNIGWRRRVELRCDVVAASYIDGEDLIAVLAIQDSLIPSRRKGTRAYRRAAKAYPTFNERVDAIRGVVKDKHTQLVA
jgi:Zn-dependent protease with chaperone function